MHAAPPYFGIECPHHHTNARSIGFDLRKSDFRSGKVQLGEYLNSLGDVTWGILCNGYEWKLFDFKDPSRGGLEIFSLDLRNDSEEIDTSKKSVDELCWEFLDIHETSYSSQAWLELSKEATAFSPDSLARAILSADVVKHIGRIIRGEYEYKANADVLVDKISELLEKGLDDSIPDWNETKQAELSKYIKGQKKVNRRAKRVAKSETNPQPTSELTTEPSTNSEISCDPSPEDEKKVA